MDLLLVVVLFFSQPSLSDIHSECNGDWCVGHRGDSCSSACEDIGKQCNPDPPPPGVELSTLLQFGSCETDSEQSPQSRCEHPGYVSSRENRYYNHCVGFEDVTNIECECSHGSVRRLCYCGTADVPAGDETPSLVICNTNEQCVSRGSVCDNGIDSFDTNPVPGITGLYFCSEPECDSRYEYRSQDGSCNNLNPGRTTYGTSGKLQNRIEPPRDNPFDGPGPRRVSDDVVKASQSKPNKFDKNALLIHFGQFVDHDLDLTSFIASGEQNLGTSIRTATVAITGSGELEDFEFTRSDRILGYQGSEVPLFANSITAFLDLNNVYGSKDDTANRLRTFQGGSLKNQWLDTSAGFSEYPPFERDVQVGMDRGEERDAFGVGDVRGNEQVGLLALHSLFLREHNKLASELNAATGGRETDEYLYREARRWNIAQYQNIVLNEFLPAIIGYPLDDYTGYDDTIIPEKHLMFSTAAFRFGHSGMPETVRVVDENDVAQEIALRQLLFVPSWVTQNSIEIGSIIKGLIQQCHETIDTEVVESLRTFLFEETDPAGMDLAALNIMRGRDHELSLYTDYRKHYDLSIPETFSDVTDDVELANKLDILYDGDVSRCDVWICGLAEDPRSGQLGELFEVTLASLFYIARDGDRFYYENDGQPLRFSTSEKQKVRDTTLADIIRRNTFLEDNSGSNSVQNAFETNSCTPTFCEFLNIGGHIGPFDVINGRYELHSIDPDTNRPIYFNSATNEYIYFMDPTYWNIGADLKSFSNVDAYVIDKTFSVEDTAEPWLVWDGAGYSSDTNVQAICMEIVENCGNCGEERLGVQGCNMEEIESCICECDSYCCATEWDSACVGKARGQDDRCNCGNCALPFTD